jgi:tetratricopeptide (TPR) repeat protein
LLRNAAVLGRTFSSRLATQVLEAEGITLDDATTELLSDFIAADGPDDVRFRHPVVRDVAYEGLPYRRRQALHLRAGEAAESLAAADPSRVADVLSLHFSLGQEHEKTWRYARLAGDRALEAYANIEAETHFVRALDAARRLALADAERAGVLTQLGDARERASLFTAALDAYKRASRLVTDPVPQAELSLRRARAKERSGSFSTALRELSSGARILASIDSAAAEECRVRLAAFGAVVRWGQERSADALRRAEAAIAAARAADVRDALSQALMIADLAELAMRGSGSGARLREALDIFTELGDLPREGQARGNLGFVAAHAGRWDEAIEWFSTSRDVFARCGDAVGRALADLNLGEALVKQRRTEEAEPVLEESARILRSVAFADGAAYAEMLLAQVWTEFKRYDEAEKLFTTVVSEFTYLGQFASALEAAIALADLRVRVDDPAGALELLESTERAAGPEAAQFRARIALVRAAALARVGRIEESQAEIAVGVADAQQRGLPHEEAMLLLEGEDIARQAGRAVDVAAVERAEEILAGLGVRR